MLNAHATEPATPSLNRPIIRRAIQLLTALHLLIAAAATAVWVESPGDPLGCHLVLWPTQEYSICAEWVDDVTGAIINHCCVKAEDLGSRNPELKTGVCAVPRPASQTDADGPGRCVARRFDTCQGMSATACFHAASRACQTPETPWLWPSR